MSEAQHMVALRRANEVRLARAALRSRVGAGLVSAAEVIRECPWEAANMSISELLGSQCRWGVTRTAKFLASIGMPEQKTIGSMTERQRNIVANLL